MLPTFFRQPGLKSATSSSSVPTFRERRAAFFPKPGYRPLPGAQDAAMASRPHQPATPGPPEPCGNTTTKSPSKAPVLVLVLVLNECMKSKLVSWHSRSPLSPACPSTLATIPSRASSPVRSVYWLPEHTPPDAVLNLPPAPLTC